MGTLLKKKSYVCILEQSIHGNEIWVFLNSELQIILTEFYHSSLKDFF